MKLTLRPKNVSEARAPKPVVFTFGRLNPPSVGHQKLIDKVQTVAKTYGAEAHVYLSHTQDAKKNPLSYDDKVAIARKAFGPVVKSGKHRHVIDVMKDLEAKGHKDVHLVVGSDRRDEFDTLLKKYNGREYNFNSITVHSAGHRDPDGDGVEAASSSKMRQHASTNNLASFKAGLPKRVRSDSTKILANVRKGMKLSEGAERSLVEKSERANMPIGLITAVFERALEVHQRTKVGYLTPHQFAFSRVNSFISGGAARKADADLEEAYLIEKDTTMGNVKPLKSIPWEKTTNHGWWEDNDHVEVYHGTHDRNVGSIAKHGVAHKDAKTGMISVTMDPHTAHGYASMSASGGERAFRTNPNAAVHTPEEDRSVVKMRIPKTWLKDNMDHDYHGNTSMYKDKISKRSSYDSWKSKNPGKSDHEHYALTEFRVKEAIPKKFIVGVMKKKPILPKPTQPTKPAPEVNHNPKLASVSESKRIR